MAKIALKIVFELKRFSHKISRGLAPEPESVCDRACVSLEGWSNPAEHNLRSSLIGQTKRWQSQGCRLALIGAAESRGGEEASTTCSPPAAPPPCFGFRVQGSGFRVQNSGFRVQGSGFRVQGSGFRVQGLEVRVQGVVFRV